MSGTTSAGYDDVRIQLCDKCGYSVLNFWHRWGCINGGRMPR